MAVELTIIGLGQIGSSIGLALADKSLEINRTGHDASADTAARAEKAGAVDKIQRNIHTAVEKADLVILAVPEDEVRQILDLIRDDLKPDSLVMDTSLLKSAPAVWAGELLPEKRHFIGFTPVLGARYLDEMKYGVEAAHADLFKDAVVLITTPAASNPDSIRVASELAGILGCKPLFIDPLEAEGLLAAVYGLPRLVSAALINATTRQPGWQEARKLAGKAYTQVSEPLMHMDGTRQFGHSAIHNRENTARVLDDMIIELQAVRDLVMEGNSEKLDQVLHNAEQARKEWSNQRQAAEWEHRPAASSFPTAGETFARLFGFRTKKPDKK
jgi:prephenate dehydrogenase